VGCRSVGSCMSIKILEAKMNVLDMRTRMPFKYGIATLTALPHVFVTVQADVDGKNATGIASDGLPPKWFTKNPDEPFRDEITAMMAVIRHAARIAEDMPPSANVFSLWQDLHANQGKWATPIGYPPLLWAFGVSLIERATIDAFCKATGTTFGEAVRSNIADDAALGIRLGDIYTELEGYSPADLLPREPLSELRVRHTVGLADPLKQSDIFDEDRLDDSLPQSLGDCIRRYGLDRFKIKINGHLEGDLERLRRLAGIIESNTVGGYQFTLDGNEQFKSVDEFRTFWNAALNDNIIAGLFGHLMFAEQPFHRSIALSAEVASGLRAWSDHPPMIIDESDGNLTSLSDALDAGYNGTSHKNCKGVFKGIANRCLIAKWAQNDPTGTYIMSAEDLANVGPVALLQDLAVIATLGIQHAERNGHHYFRGLSMLPSDVQTQILDQHADLYERHIDGYPTMTIRNGRIRLGSVVNSAFGVGINIDPSRFVAAEEWSPDGLGDI
jgi:hypothetical protein